MTPYNGLTLAYLGDAAYEILIREHLLLNGYTKVDNLHREAVKFTCAEGQAKAFDLIEELLTEDEYSIFKKGRNAKSDRRARSASLADYKKATGFESLIGYLHLDKNIARINELLTVITNGIDNTNDLK